MCPPAIFLPDKAAITAPKPVGFEVGPSCPALFCVC